jgi:hypothetical protein
LAILDFGFWISDYGFLIPQVSLPLARVMEGAQPLKGMSFILLPSAFLLPDTDIRYNRAQWL